jgi:cohesin loading factor subunit SCC2
LIKLSDTNKKAGQFRWVQHVFSFSIRTHNFFSLRDGRLIRTVSALLLQLVQTSAHDVRLEANKIGKARQQVFALRRQDSNNDVGAEAFLDENDAEVCLPGDA